LSGLEETYQSVKGSYIVLCKHLTVSDHHSAPPTSLWSMKSYHLHLEMLNLKGFLLCSSNLYATVLAYSWYL